MSNEATRLAACPFCGTCEALTYEDDWTCWVTYCRLCGASGPDNVKNTQVASIEAWNYRAPDTGAREASLKEAAQLCENISDKYGEEEGGRWPELKSDAQTGARDCESAIRALATKTADAATETKQETNHG